MGDGLYEKFDREKSRAENDWIRFFIIPFHNAYIDAHRNFMAKIDEQKKADEAAQKRIAELAMTALAFCGGQLCTAVFASAALKTHAAQLTLDTLYKHNMNRTFTAVAFLTENKTAHLALGKLWEKGKDLLSSKLKKELEETNENYPSLADFTQEPQKLRNHLELWMRSILAKVIAAEKEISTRNEQIRAVAVENLLDAPFLAQAPTKPLAGARTIEEIELAFYMRYMLELDYIAEGHKVTRYMRGDNWDYEFVQKRTPINESPTSEKYPKDSRKGNDFTQVRFDRVGDILRKRIDELAKSRLGSAFFEANEHLSQKTLLRAEAKLTELAAVNIGEIKKNMSTVPDGVPDAVSGAG